MNALLECLEEELSWKQKPQAFELQAPEISCVEKLRALLFEQSFIHRHRSCPKDFTRTRRLCFGFVMVLVLQKTLRSLQLHLHDFFEKLCSIQGTLAGSVSASAWSQARKKLRHTAFIELNEEAVLSSAYSSPQSLCFWQDYRLLAVDSSVLRLPRSHILLEHFGGQEELSNDKGPCRFQRPVPHCRLSVLYDCANRLVLHAQVGSYKDNERGLLLEHFKHMAACPGGGTLRGLKDLILADRGYAGYGFISECARRGMDFVVRCQKQSFVEVSAFFSEDKEGMSRIITLRPYQRLGRKKAEALGLPEAMRVRLVSVRLESGELEVLMSSLLDEARYGAGDFGALYQMRWGVESFFGLIKGRLGLENFSGRSVEAVLQDIHATILLCNLESVLTRGAAAQLRQPGGKPVGGDKRLGRLRHRKQINRAVSFHALKSRAMELLLGKKPVAEVVSELSVLFVANPVSSRPQRARPRTPTPRSRVIDYLKRVKKQVF